MPMRGFSTICFVLIFFAMQAQNRERVITGTLTDSEGLPLPGVNIMIKGTTIGTSTNAQGKYSITVPIGSTLVFAFIGMQTREFIVTENSLKKMKSTVETAQRSQPLSWGPLLHDNVNEQDQKGVATLGPKSAVYLSESGVVKPTDIRRIRKLPAFFSLIRTGGKHRNAFVIDDFNPPVATAYGLQFTSTIGLEKVTRLPSLQNNFAQGRTINGVVTWRGPEYGEEFSWGPLLKTLEYDGSDYTFDSNGRLTIAGAGSGKAANTYDNSLFRKGYSSDNAFSLVIPGPRAGIIDFDASRTTRSGVIPNSSFNKNTIGLHFKKVRISEALEGSFSVLYNLSKGKLLNHGATYANLFASSLLSPPSFDVTNGTSQSLAVNNASVYRLEDGSPRSASPSSIDNPYGLLSELPDNDRQERIVASSSFRYAPDSHFQILITDTYDRQENKTIFGVPHRYSSYVDGRQTNRAEIENHFFLNVRPNYQWYAGESRLQVHTSYQLSFKERSIERSDVFGLTEMSNVDSTILLRRKPFRRINEFSAGLQWERNGIHLKVLTRAYYSNTISRQAFTNFLPTAGLNVSLHELLYVNCGLKLFAMYSTSVNEAPLVYSNSSYLSNQVQAKNFNKVYESNELFASLGVPEKVNKFEAGIEMKNFHNIDFDIKLFRSTTNGFISPVWNGNEYSLNNVADLDNIGYTISTRYWNGYRHAIDWNVGARWSTYNTVVDKLYGNEKFLSIGGFSDIQSVIASGDVYGAIYGTTYLRDANRNIIIGDDGFPVVDQTLKRIGNPIPDWTLSFDGKVRYWRFELSALCEYKKGGDMWNGTRAVLDYSGRSSSSGEKRSTSGHVFDGVNAQGKPNAIPVSFYDPSKPIQENRWVRYGFIGVGEDYVEDSSWFRLNELCVSYVTKIANLKVREVKLSFIGRNLFYASAYDGVDPSNTLFGYAGITGLDLFNTPSTRSYHAQLIVKI
jgi:hypothetical protein